MPVSARATIVLGLVATLGACEEASTPFELQSALQGAAGLVFLTQPHDFGAYPEALFQGAVVADAAGCLRLSAPTPDDATVVWPSGYTLTDTPAGPAVLDRQGNEVGVIGRAFTLGGGHMGGQLEGFTGLTDSEVSAVKQRCPGGFWLTSP